MDRAFKGIWIPKEVWLSKELTLQEKSLIPEIDSLDNDNGCYASNKYFANFMGLSERQIKRMIQSLVKKGWVTSKIIYKENSKEIEKRILRVRKPPYPENQPSDKNVPTPSDKNGRT